MAESVLEAEFALHLRAAGLTSGLVREFRFHPSRRWRFDFAWPEQRLAVEVEGGHWSGGRHTRGSGFEADCEKYLHAVVEGWRVLRVTGSMVKSGVALVATSQILNKGNS